MRRTASLLRLLLATLLFNNKEMKKHYLLIFAIIAPLILLYTLSGPIPQDQAYHSFADQRSFFGLPNFFDIFSNIFFFIPGILGIRLCMAKNAQFNISWKLFFLSVCLVAPGSVFYHYGPNDFAMIWDRLPMTLAFTSLTVAILTDTFHWKYETPLLIALPLVGAYSILHWQIFNDLRPYAWVQLTPIICVLLLACLYKKNGLTPKYLFLTFFFYSAAKLTENFDLQIFQFTNLCFSGHSIKHILAAAAVYCLYLMKKSKLSSSK